MVLKHVNFFILEILRSFYILTLNCSRPNALDNKSKVKPLKIKLNTNIILFSQGRGRPFKQFINKTIHQKFIAIDVVLVSLLLTLNIFHTLF